MILIIPTYVVDQSFLSELIWYFFIQIIWSLILNLSILNI